MSDLAPRPGAPLLDAAAARAGDAAAVAAGDTWSGLMARAAGHLAREVRRLAGHGYGLRVAIVVGKGNNGGDGWAAALRLAAAGAQPWVVAVAPLDAELSAEAAAFRAAVRARGLRVAGVDELAPVLAWADVVVDAVLGTGFSGELRGDVAHACRAIAAARAGGTPVVACDVPSGVSADDGRAADGAVRADLTVTFGERKRGLLLAPGASHAGRVVVGDLGPRYAPPPSGWRALTACDAAPSPLRHDAEKRDRGVVLVVAGSVGAGGAAVLTTRGALHAGAGLVTLATPAHLQRVLVPAVPAAMTRPLRHEGAHLSADAAGQLADAGDVDAVVAGPGLGPTPGVGEVIAHLRRTARRLVLDADALNVHRDDPASLAEHAGALVLTPHRRELARIGGGRDEHDAWERRVERVPRLAAELGATIVAKGPGTLVAAPDGRVWVTPIGGPELATGGTGDVLAGMLGAAIARADDIPLAVARTVWQHAWAGRHLAGRSGRLASATALVDGLPAALDALVAAAAATPDLPFEGQP